MSGFHAPSWIGLAIEFTENYALNKLEEEE